MESPGRQNEAAGLKGIAVNAAARTKRQTVKQRSASTRAKASIRRNGEASLTRHAIAAGLPLREARSMASSLRDNARKLGVTGHQVVVRVRGHRVTSTRYTVAQVREIAAAYRPRLAARKTARQYLLAA
jgi:hypothetical protein